MVPDNRRFLIFQGRRGATIDAFVAGAGTGGTLIGVGTRLKEVFPDLKLVAVEPSVAAVMSGGSAGEHGIAGIGDGFIPAIASDGANGLNEAIDEVICINETQAREAAKRLRRDHGFCVGISSGANYLASRAMHETCTTVVSVFSDSYVRYESVGLRHCEPGHCPYEHDPVV